MVKTKQKKRVSADVLTSKKLSTKAKKINPFEVHTNKEKFTIMGRQLKHDKGMPGVSRAKALQRRRDTLGQEYLNKNKSNAFRDQRIGEGTMTREEAASARFIAERLQQQQKAGQRREARFNLNDDDDDDGGLGGGGGGNQLTHKGQTLSEIEQFEDGVSDGGGDDDDDDVLGKLDDQFTGAAHFGGGGAKGDETDRKAAIKDFIAEQKRRKEEISKEKDEVSVLTQKLDADWRALIPLMATTSYGDEKKPKPDAYDVAKREMVFDKCGSVTDRLKSEADVARAEKERLEKLERERLERMSGVTEEEKRTKHRSADDLDDGYFVQPVVAEKATLAYDLDGKTTKKSKKSAGSDSDDEEMFESARKSDKKASNDDDEEEDNEEDDESGSDDDEDGSEEGDDDEDDDDDDSDSDDSLNDLRASDSETDAPAVDEKSNKRQRQTSETDAAAAATAVKKPKTIITEAERQERMRRAAAELPYTFELPDTYDDLDALLRTRNADFQCVIVQRMIACNHPKLAPENKPHMVTLFGYLLQHLNDTFESATAQTVGEAFRTLDLLTGHLYDLSQISPAETTQCFKSVIKEKQSDFRGGQVKHYPSLDTLVFLKLVTHLYSTSDYRHQVVTPCYLFAGQMLTRCRPATRADIASGLFLVNVLLEYAQLSKRFVPAAWNFLAGVVFLALRKRSVEVLRVVPPFKATGELSSLLALPESKQAKAKTPTADEDLSLQFGDLLELDFDDAARIRLLYGALRLSADMLRMHSENDGAAYFVANIEPYLQRLDLQPYPKAVRKAAADCESVMAAIRERPLQLIAPAAKKPKALRLLEPMFEKVYDDKRTRRPGNIDKIVREGMLRKIKSETRGAIREIRRDNAYVASMQLKDQMARDAERKEKVRRIFSEASIQQGELNAMDRAKKHM